MDADTSRHQIPHHGMHPLYLQKVDDTSPAQPVEYTLLGRRMLDALTLRLWRLLLLPLLRTFRSTTTSSRRPRYCPFCSVLNRYIRSKVPKKVPRIAPARVPPEYCPEHEVDELLTTVVVACRATSTGVAGTRAETKVATGACQKHEHKIQRGMAMRIPYRSPRHSNGCVQVNAPSTQTAYGFSNSLVYSNGLVRKPNPSASASRRMSRVRVGLFLPAQTPTGPTYWILSVT